MATKEEWKNGFRQLNDREPSVEEFLEAQANGEIESEEIEENIKQEQSVSSKTQNNANRQVFKKNKRYFIIGGAVIAIIIVAIGIFSFMSSRPKDIINEVKIEFSGYNKAGSATLSGNYQSVMKSIIAKKVGYSNSDVEAVQKGNEQVLTADYTKSRQVEKYIEDTTVRLNKESNLSNGDKLILSVKTSLKDNPIKSSKKTIKVSGLKKSKIYTMEALMKKYPIKVTGYNHFGSLDYNHNFYELANSSDSDTTSNEVTELKNGDSVKLSLSGYIINGLLKKGYVLQGEKTTTIKVSDLLDSPKISNLNDLLNQLDAVVKKLNKSDGFNTYTVSRQDSYFIGKNISAYDTKGFSIVTIYKVDDDSTALGEHEHKTKYVVDGYEGLELTKDKVNIPAREEADIYFSPGEYTSSKEALDSLKSDYPSLVKIN